MRIGQTRVGYGWLTQSTSRRPAQTIGAAVPPSTVGTVSPTRRCSTATSPWSVAIRVPAAKQAALTTGSITSVNTAPSSTENAAPASADTTAPLVTTPPESVTAG